MPRKGALRIRPAEAAHVKFVKYRDPSGYFTMNVPLGWKVRTGLKPDGKIDLISYAITAYDPKRPERELYYTWSTTLGLDANNHANGQYYAAVPATCTAQGYTEGYYCSACGRWYSGIRSIPGPGSWTWGRRWSSRFSRKPL